MSAGDLFAVGEHRYDNASGHLRTNCQKQGPYVSTRALEGWLQVCEVEVVGALSISLQMLSED